MLIAVFWITFFIVFYTYLGYPVVIWGLSRCFPYQSASAQQIISEEPAVSIIVAALNEQQWVTKKMANIYALDYPEDKIEIIWVIDGSTDQSEKILASYRNVMILNSGTREGKTAALNHAVLHANNPILIFTDANCLINDSAIRHIVREFDDPSIGCVSGEKRVSFAVEDDLASKGESLYWKYESKLKEWDYRYYSTVGAAGELFAIRKDLYVPQPIDTILDDFMISMLIAKEGYRIAYTHQAYAVESGSLNMEEEQKRKIRIAAGGIQSVLRLIPLLKLWCYGRLSFQYLSHRLLRWTIAPICLILMFIINWTIVLGDWSLNNVFWIILFLQLLFYVCALFGYIQSKRGKAIHRIFYVPYYFLFMNLNVCLSVPYLIGRQKDTGWEKSKRKD